MNTRKQLLLSTLIAATAFILPQTAFAKYIQGGGGGTLEVDDCTDTTVLIGGTWSTMPFGATCHGIMPSGGVLVNSLNELKVPASRPSSPSVRPHAPVIYSGPATNMAVKPAQKLNQHIQLDSGMGHSKRVSGNTKSMNSTNTGFVEDTDPSIKRHKRKPSNAGIRTKRDKFIAAPDSNDGSGDTNNKIQVHNPMRSNRHNVRKSNGGGLPNRVQATDVESEGDVINKANASPHKRKKSMKGKTKFVNGGSVATGLPEDASVIFKKHKKKPSRRLQYGLVRAEDAAAIEDEQLLAGHGKRRTKRNPIDRPKFVMDRAGNVGVLSKEGSIKGHSTHDSVFIGIHTRLKSHRGEPMHRDLTEVQVGYIECPISSKDNEGMSALIKHGKRKSPRQGSQNTSCPKW